MNLARVMGKVNWSRQMVKIHCDKKSLYLDKDIITTAHCAQCPSLDPGFLSNIGKGCKDIHLKV